MERSIELNDTSLKERIVSLAATQLVTSLRPRIEPKSPSNLPSQSGEGEQPPPSAAYPLVQPEDEIIEHVAITIGGGVKPHGAFSLPLGYGLIRSGFWFSPNWGLISAISFEGGIAERQPGTVVAMSGLVGFGVVRRIVGGQFLHLELSGIASIGYTYLKGTPLHDMTGHELGGIAGEFATSLGVGINAKGMILVFELLGGYTLKNPIGSVVEDESVTLGGFWIGGGLRIGVLKK